jgi:hypothetical protein
MWRQFLVAVAGLALAALSARPPSVAGAGVGELVPVRPELTRVLMKSCLPLVVDVYWLRAINAVGTSRTESEFRNLAEYGRVLTTLDPDFVDAYWLIGISVPFNRGREDWVNGELAIDLLQRGATRFPEALQLHLLLGYSLMTFTTRYVEAAQAFEHAAKLPQAPPYAALLATRLYLRGDQFETAVALAASMRDAASSEQERARFEDRVNELYDERELRRIDSAAAAFRQRNARLPTTLAELVAAGLLEPPHDERFKAVRFDAQGRTLLPETRGRMKLFHDSFGGRDDDAPETWR